MNPIANNPEELRRELLAQLTLVKQLICALDDLDDTPSRPLELALELQQRLAHHEWDVLTDLVAASANPGHVPVRTAQPATTSAARSVPVPGNDWVVSEPLEQRAAKINPRTAGCFHGYYSEEFGDQNVVSSALVWLPPARDDAVPDWAMRDAWPQFARGWDQLTQAAWDRCHPPVAKTR